MSNWDVFGLGSMAVLLIAAFVLYGCEKGWWRVRDFRSLPLSQKTIVLVFLAIAVAVGATKTNVPPRVSAPPDQGESGSCKNGNLGGRTDTHNFTFSTLHPIFNPAAGFVLARVGTNETWDFSPPAGAVVHRPWFLRGAHRDRFDVGVPGWGIPFGTNFISGFVVSSTGVLVPRFDDEVMVPPERLEDVENLKWMTENEEVVVEEEGHRAAFAVLSAPLGVVPEANWSNVGIGFSSRAWWYVTPSNSFMVAFENALLGRRADSPVSALAEFLPDGSFVYRYDLSRAAGTSPFAVVGARNGVIAETMPLIAPTNLTSLFFQALAPGDAPWADLDGDGLSTADEVFAYRTDPALADTDGDGLSDGEEVAGGSNPLARDTDGDGYADVTDPDPTTPTSRIDTDGDGIPDVWRTFWFGSTATSAMPSDGNVDGISDLAAVWAGVNPTNVPSPGFVAFDPRMPVSMNAWEVFPSAFSFVCPAALSLIATRTFAVSRTSPWQQFFISSSPFRATGWESVDVEILYGLDGGPVTNVVPSVSADSWRLPLCGEMPATVEFRLVATGGNPALSRPLYLLRWTPHLVFSTGLETRVSHLVDNTCTAPPCLAARRAVSGRFELQFSADLSDYPHLGGIDAAATADLELPPIPSLGVEGTGSTRCLVADDPLFVTLPPEGTNTAVGVCCYEFRQSYPGAVSTGPCASPLASPYPLSVGTVRLAFHSACTDASVSGFVASPISYEIFPDDARVGVCLEGSTYSSSRYIELYPNQAGIPVIDQRPDPPGRIEVADDVPERFPTPQKEGDEPEAADDCACGGDSDSVSLGSFRLKIPLGRPYKDSLSGYVWSSIKVPTAITPAVFNVLAAPDVVVARSSVVGAFTAQAPGLHGRTVSVDCISNGVRITVLNNASERTEFVWEVTNPGGDATTIRARRLTVTGNVTEDRTFMFDDGVTVMDDSLRGTTTVRAHECDEDDPSFVVRVEEETFLPDDDSDWPTSRTVYEYARIGFGSASVRRLVRRHGVDADGEFDETMNYVCDGTNPLRHGRIRSLRSNRRAWGVYDYDDLGRETLRLEPLDGGHFPEGLDVPALDCDLPPWSATMGTVTSYEPAAGDSVHSNDRDLPRRVDVYVRRFLEPGDSRGRIDPRPVHVLRETWTYSREVDAGGVPCRRCVHTRGLGATVQTDETLVYPEDAAVPPHLRGLTVHSLDSDGVETSYERERGDWDAAARVFTLDPVGGYLRERVCRTRGIATDPTFREVVYELAHRFVVFEGRRRTDTLALLGWSVSSYDDVDRLRAVVHSDGTSETNAYSCCRLLWRRGRDGRTMLRSAETGRDTLYYAEEDVWLADVFTNVLSRTSSPPVFRVTQHWMDALGRETNVTAYATSEPGRAVVPAVPEDMTDIALLESTAYLGYGAEMKVDGRGSFVWSWRTFSEGEESFSSVSGPISEYVDFDYGAHVVVSGGYERRNGERYSYADARGRSTRPTRHSTFWNDDGLRNDVDMGLDIVSYREAWITNRVVRYDVLGRISVTETPLGVTSNVYDGTSSRLVRTITTFCDRGRAFMETGTAERTVEYIFDAMGVRVGSVETGVTNRIDVTYEVENDVEWRVTTRTAAGPGVATTEVVRERLTGLSDAVRACTVVVGVDGVVATNTVSYDPATLVETSCTLSSLAMPVIERSVHGLVLESEAEGEVYANLYDAFGRVVRVERRTIGGDEWTPVSESSYNGMGDLVSLSTFTNAVFVSTERYAYDYGGRLVATTNALGAVVMRDYDAFGGLVTVDGASYPELRGYDTDGRLVSLRTTRNGGATWDETRWEHDAATGLLLAKIYADGSRESYTYTPAGLLARTTLADGRWARNVYDTSGRLTNVVYSARHTGFAFENDALGNLVRVVSEAGGVWEYARAAEGTLTNETFELEERVISLSRTLDGCRRPMGWALAADGSTKGGVSYGYDGENHISSVAITNAQGRACMAVYSYEAGYGCGYELVTPNGSVLHRAIARDPYRRSLMLDCITTFVDAPIASFAYTFDAGGRLVTRNDDTFDYNDHDEIISATIGTNRIEHAYDTIGNHVFFTCNAMTNLLENNALNQTMTIRDNAVEMGGTSLQEGRRTLVWNANGGLARDGGWAFVYDTECRLVEAFQVPTTNDALRIVYAYDHLGRRIHKMVYVRMFVGMTVPGGGPPSFIQTPIWDLRERRDFVYDDWNLVHETAMTVDANAATNVSEIQYFWGVDLSGSLQGAGGVGGLLAESRNGQFYFPVYDNNGNVVKYVDETGSVVAAYVYDDFGRVIEKIGPMADGFRFLFSTKSYEPETGLYYYGYRFYSPELKMWLTRDPLKEDGSLNLYSFCENDGISRMDYVGLISFEYISYDGDGRRVYVNDEDAIPVKTETIVVDQMGVPFKIPSLQSPWGMFSSQVVDVDKCLIRVEVSLKLDPRLEKRVPRGTTYTYYPHTKDGEGGGISYGSYSENDRRYPMWGGAWAHEHGHARAFFKYAKPMFEKKVADYNSINPLSSSSLEEVRKILLEVFFHEKVIPMSSKYANEKTAQWHVSNGFGLRRQRVYKVGSSRSINQEDSPYVFVKK